MSQIFQCGENTALVGYVYDECDAPEREAIDAHIAICAACAAELAALQSTRVSLTSWAPPEAGLGFQIVRPAKPVPEAGQAELPGPQIPEGGPWYARPVPVWAQAVAATLIFAAGVSLGVARGIMPAAVTPGEVPVSVVGGAVSAADLEAMERRLRAEMSRIQSSAAGVGDAAAPAVSEEQLLARVRTLIEESALRQRRELALRTAQIVRDFDSQRRVDLAQIQSTFGQIEGLTGAEVREQRQMLDYLIRVSQQR
jgi:hypothetical protein